MIWGGSAGRSGGKGNWSGSNICKKKKDNDTRYTEDTVTYLVWVTHPRRYQIPRTQVITKMSI